MNLTDFPILTTNLPARRNERLGKALDVLVKAVDQGGITNPAYQDVKSDVNRALDEGWRNAIASKYRWAGKYMDLTPEEQELDLNPQAHNIASCFKKLDKSKLDTPMVRDMRAFLNEVKPLADAVVSLKDKVIKRQPKADPIDLKAKYSAPAASTSAMKMVLDLLTEVTDKHYQELRQQFIDRFNVFVVKYVQASKELAANGKRHDVYSYHHKNNSRHVRPGYTIVSNCVEDAKFDRRTGTIKPATPKADFMAFIEKEATKAADQIREGFLIKNLAKIDSIIEKKGDFSEAKVIGRELSMSGLRGSFRFDFKSGASFSVDNSVVWSHSKYGTPFLQYPLRFRDVVMSDGSRMKMPSEEKMNTIFA